MSINNLPAGVVVEGIKVGYPIQGIIGSRQPTGKGWEGNHDLQLKFDLTFDSSLLITGSV